jgi:hypothetical protein
MARATAAAWAGLVADCPPLTARRGGRPPWDPLSPEIGPTPYAFRARTVPRLLTFALMRCDDVKIGKAMVASRASGPRSPSDADLATSATSPCRSKCNVDKRFHVHCYLFPARLRRRPGFDPGQSALPANGCGDRGIPTDEYTIPCPQTLKKRPLRGRARLPPCLWGTLLSLGRRCLSRSRPASGRRSGRRPGWLRMRPPDPRRREYLPLGSRQPRGDNRAREPGRFPPVGDYSTESQTRGRLSLPSA